MTAESSTLIETCILTSPMIKEYDGGQAQEETKNRMIGKRAVKNSFSRYPYTGSSNVYLHKGFIRLSSCRGKGS